MAAYATCLLLWCATLHKYLFAGALALGNGLMVEEFFLMTMSASLRLAFLVESISAKSKYPKISAHLGVHSYYIKTFSASYN
jgi:hypothetical protein